MLITSEVLLTHWTSTDFQTSLDVTKTLLVPSGVSPDGGANSRLIFENGKCHDKRVQRPLRCG